MVYLGEFPGVSGPGLTEPRRPPSTPSSTPSCAEQLDATLAHAEAFPDTFEEMIAADDGSPERTAMLDVITALEEQGGPRGRGRPGARRPGELRGLSDRCAAGAVLATAFVIWAVGRCVLRRQADDRAVCQDEPAPTPSSLDPPLRRPARRPRPPGRPRPPRAGALGRRGHGGRQLGHGLRPAAARRCRAEDRRAFAVGNNFFNDNWVTAPASTAGATASGRRSTPSPARPATSRTGGPSRPSAEDPTELGLLLRLSVPGPDRRSPSRCPATATSCRTGPSTACRPRRPSSITYHDAAGHFADGTPYSLAGARRTRSLTRRSGRCPAGHPDQPPRRPAGVRRRAPGGRAGGRRPRRGRSGRRRRRRHLGPPEPGAPTWRTGAPASAASAGRPTSPPWSSRTPAPSTATSASPRRCFPDAELPARADRLRGGAQRRDARGGRGQARNASPSTRGRSRCPPAGTSGSPDTTEGEELFGEPGLRVLPPARAARPARATSPALSNQVIHPYTDLLLHDMGPGLADGRPDGEATGSEWRTPPLWGIGLVETVNRHTRFLHDGRARNLTEAILWHGGEAEASAEAFQALSAAERATPSSRSWSHCEARPSGRHRGAPRRPRRLFGWRRRQRRDHRGFGRRVRRARPARRGRRDHRAPLSDLPDGGGGAGHRPRGPLRAARSRTARTPPANSGLRPARPGGRRWPSASARP